MPSPWLVRMREAQGDRELVSTTRGKALDITVEDPELHAHGTIPLDGLASGLTNLRGNCPQR